MTVRPATGFDEAAMVEAWRLALDVRGRPPSKARQTRVRAKLRDPLALTLVAEHDGAVVGMLLAEPFRVDGVLEPGVLHLAMLFVAPAWQRAGHGTALVTALLDRYPSVRVWSSGAIELYEGLGFRRTGLELDLGVQLESPALQADPT